MTGPTPNLALDRPVSSTNYDVTVHNSNMTKLDAMMARAIICTSSTRPSTTYPGLVAFETDTGLMIVRNAANTSWLLFTEVYSCTNATRPTATHPGMLIYETDTGWVVMRNGTDTAWVTSIQGVCVFDTQVANGTTTSATYTPTLAGGVACGFAFVAPPTGRILVYNSCGLSMASGAPAAYSFCTPVVKNGNVVGGGTDFLAASDDNAVINHGSNEFRRFGASQIVPGLTPGGFYNIQQQFKSGSAGDSALFQRKKLIIQPCG